MPKLEIIGQCGKHDKPIYECTGKCPDCEIEKTNETLQKKYDWRMAKILQIKELQQELKTFGDTKAERQRHFSDICRIESDIAELKGQLSKGSIYG
jgi:hypothetical protein